MNKLSKNVKVFSSMYQWNRAHAFEDVFRSQKPSEIQDSGCIGRGLPMLDQANQSDGKQRYGQPVSFGDASGCGDRRNVAENSV